MATEVTAGWQAHATLKRERSFTTTRAARDWLAGQLEIHAGVTGKSAEITALHAEADMLRADDGEYDDCVAGVHYYVDTGY